MPSGTDDGDTFYSIWGTSPSDVFAVGFDAGEVVILHYDGTSWSEMQSGTEQDFYGVWGTSPSDVFSVSLEGTILHHDGTGWRSLTLSINHAVLQGVWGRSDSDLFVVGDAGTMLRGVR